MVIAARRQITRIKADVPGITSKRIGNVDLTTTVEEMASAKIRDVVSRRRIRIRETVPMVTRKPTGVAKEIMIVVVMEYATIGDVANQ